MLTASLIGVMLSKIVSRYYFHTGLIVLGVVLVFIVACMSLSGTSPLESIIPSMLLGCCSAFIFYPVFKYYSILRTLLSIAILAYLLYFLRSFLSIESTALVVIASISLYSIFNYKSIPYWFLLFLWVFGEWLLRLRYKIIFEGTNNLSSSQGILLLSNHMSWLDWLIIQLPIKRRVHYLINTGMYNKPFIHYFIALQGCIPISRHASKQGFKTAKKLLHKNHVIGAFPEGSISKTGMLGNFYSGFEYIRADKGHIVPLYIEGMWGSRLSRSKEKFCEEKSGFRRVIRVYFGTPMPLSSNADAIKSAIAKLRQKN